MVSPSLRQQSQDTLRSLRNQLFARMQKLPVSTSIPTNTGILCRSTPMTSMLFAKRSRSLSRSSCSLPLPLSGSCQHDHDQPSPFPSRSFDGRSHGLCHQRYLWQIWSLFRRSAKNLGIENGFIEEMMSGQRLSRPSFMKRKY